MAFRRIPRIAALLCYLGAAWLATRPLPPRVWHGSRLIRPGVVHRTVIDKSGPWKINIVEIDIRRPDLAVETARAFDGYFGRETTSSIGARKSDSSRSVVAALNGDYFNPATGEVQNNQITAGIFVKAFASPGIRKEFVDIPNSQFAMTVEGKPLIDQFTFDGSVLWPDHSSTPLAGVNVAPRKAGLIVFNRYRGDTAPPDQEEAGTAELPLTVARQAGDTSFCYPDGPVSYSSGSAIPSLGFVLAAYGESSGLMKRKLPQADTVVVVLSVKPRWGRIRDLIGGWPRIVRDGRSIFRTPGFPENPEASVFAKRHPRSGVGFSRDSTTLYFITVDGRQESSIGMSLPEFADLMVSLGVAQGLNLDGGGSTTLVIDGSVVNSPSDPTGERPVGNCLLLLAYRRNIRIPVH